jgi:hypothetical protein
VTRPRRTCLSTLSFDRAARVVQRFRREGVLRRRMCGPSAPARIHFARSAGRAFTFETKPHSDVLLHLAGTAACRLQPIRQLRLPRALRFRFVRATRSPVWPGPLMTNRVRACHRTTQDAFRRVRVLQAFTPGASMLATSGLNSLAPMHTVSPSFGRRSRQRYDDFLRASATRFFSLGSPCDFPSA